jgi:hypothetical protein
MLSCQKTTFQDEIGHITRVHSAAKSVSGPFPRHRRLRFTRKAEPKRLALPPREPPWPRERGHAGKPRVKFHWAVLARNPAV